MAALVGNFCGLCSVSAVFRRCFGIMKSAKESQTIKIVILPRLLDKLSQGVSRLLTLVCAPAGYGKTSLVSSFRETYASP